MFRSAAASGKNVCIGNRINKSIEFSISWKLRDRAKADDDMLRLRASDRFLDVADESFQRVTRQQRQLAPKKRRANTACLRFLGDGRAISRI